MKILILGHGRHGKDTVGNLISQQTGLRFQSSSMAACETAIFPILSLMYGYKSVQECFEDRINHRQEWKDLISEYNYFDKSSLCKKILKNHDGYIGMRCPEEYAASRHLFGMVLWVDASKRLPEDPTMLIRQDSNMFLIDNNGSFGDLEYVTHRISLILKMVMG